MASAQSPADSNLAHPPAVRAIDGIEVRATFAASRVRGCAPSASFGQTSQTRLAAISTMPWSGRTTFVEWATTPFGRSRARSRQASLSSACMGRHNSPCVYWDVHKPLLTPPEHAFSPLSLCQVRCCADEQSPPGPPPVASWLPPPPRPQPPVPQTPVVPCSASYTENCFHSDCCVSPGDRCFKRDAHSQVRHGRSTRLVRLESDLQRVRLLLL